MSRTIGDRRGKVIAARRCNDNAAVYLAPGGSWEENPAFARTVTKRSDQQRLLRLARVDAENRLVSYPHLADEEKHSEP